MRVAAIRPAARASVTVAGPVTASPPAKTPTRLVVRVTGSTWMVLPLPMRTPKLLGSCGACPMAAAEGMNNGGDSRFIGKVDLEHIGASGHSFGGYATAAVADMDPRIDAIAPMAAVGRERENYTCPAMVLLATEDATIGLPGNARIRQYYDESKGPRYLVEMVNGGHYSFTEMYQVNPDFGDGVGNGKRITNGDEIEYIPMERAFKITNSYTTAFFGRYLKGLTGYDEYLTANHYPDDIIYKGNVPSGDG